MLSDKKQKTFRDDLKLSQPHVLLATFFGSGFVNTAPGTSGSFAGLILAVLLFTYLGSSSLLIGLIIISALALWSISRFQEETQTHDSPSIVIDEVAGLFLTFFAIDAFGHLDIMAGIAGFILFRVFDIFKPWPVSAFDSNMSGAQGVLLDDLFAGFYAALSVMGLAYLGYL